MAQAVRRPTLQRLLIMARYILRRLLQGIPLVLIITLVLFVILASLGDPLATFGGVRRRLPPARTRDRARDA